MSHEDEIIAAAREADGVVPEPKQEAQGDRQNPIQMDDDDDGNDGDADFKDEVKPKTDAGEEKKGGEPAPAEVEETKKHDQRISKLKFLLEKSSIYSRIMGERMDAERKKRIENANKKASSSAVVKAESSSSAAKGARRGTRQNPAGEQDTDAPSELPSRTRKKRKTEDTQYEISSYLDKDDLEAATAAAAADKDESTSAGKKRGRAPADDGADEADEKAQENERRQPRTLTGAKMRDYQLDGLDWLISLYENGLNGILADEMGLGKTIQTISFFAHLRENGVWGPFLVCAPLSTITNWVLEFERFTPDIPVILYYGTAPERAELRTKHKLNWTPSTQEAKDAFPIVVSSYEVIMRDRPYLANLDWKYIVVDEGHRLKNMNCKLVRELKSYRSANRLILTGTPLHNNLAELWSLLNFILPDIFDDLATFEKWFDFSDLHEEGDNGGNKLLSKEQSGSIITQLHAILKPFLLRRLKADVESDLPPKKEYLLYAPLTEEQKDLYEAVLGKDIRRWLLERKTGLKWEEISDIIEGEWEEKRAGGYEYNKKAGRIQEIEQEEEERAAENQIITIDDSDEEVIEVPQQKRSDVAGPSAEAVDASTRSSITAVESPVSQAVTRPGTPTNGSTSKEGQTPRRSGRKSAAQSATPTTPAEVTTPTTAPASRPRGRPRNDGLPAGSLQKIPKKKRAPGEKRGPYQTKAIKLAAALAAEKAAGSTQNSPAQEKASGESTIQVEFKEDDDADLTREYHVIDDDDEDEDFVMKDVNRANRPQRYPRRRARKEINYGQLDADFNEREWRQIDAGEGGEEGDGLGGQEQARLSRGVAAWHGTSASGSGLTVGSSSRQPSGPSSLLMREVGKRRANELSTEFQGKKWLVRDAQKEINHLHLENIVMQLRKICCHPFLFDWPVDRDAGVKVVNEDLIHASGKMLMLNRLLDALFARGHKVLIFSQFTTMLDIMEDWATEYKGLRICRIDGSTSQDLRRTQMKSFNEEKGPDACNLFLLSTRAGGLGINLVAADTVIFYDSDWNPQMDLQAQDRVHRIGQTKPVLIFRLVSANTVEQKILKRAGNKRKLEALVIQQGKFKLPAGITRNTLTGRGGGAAGGSKGESLAEMAAALLRLDGERVQLARKGDEIISDANLDRLLDRSPEAYQRKRGWVGAMDGGEHVEGEEEDGKPGAKASAASAQAAFEVTSTEVGNDVNDAVARLMAGEN
ncbi:unnamed protein product [Tilletia laevis]|uniref:Uncharacterized protein n=4 Tax=Tilletia TaxID=13289 RepID=A0A8X7SVJ8_9BASI|nr:hypothetical protein CF336_g5952 [Tilletia laevis]KAE8192822.1 hypothetical protein CF328_g5239 [Tilletia controversa]KAE8256464.1 hypothetical protein A4X03_0g5381 [Tilletia caries]KAE8243857.1 hypothetical protein A4X06_0g6078 [Tilletia controversa]CAD6887025.1 unnamed protein product [Tilletia caries]